MKAIDLRPTRRVVPLIAIAVLASNVSLALAEGSSARKTLSSMLREETIDTTAVKSALSGIATEDSWFLAVRAVDSVDGKLTIRFYSSESPTANSDSIQASLPYLDVIETSRLGSYVEFQLHMPDGSVRTYPRWQLANLPRNCQTRLCMSCFVLGERASDLQTQTVEAARQPVRPVGLLRPRIPIGWGQELSVLSVASVAGTALGTAWYLSERRTVRESLDSLQVAVIRGRAEDVAIWTTDVETAKLRRRMATFVSIGVGALSAALVYHDVLHKGRGDKRSHSHRTQENGRVGLLLRPGGIGVPSELVVRVPF